MGTAEDEFGFEEDRPRSIQIPLTWLVKAVYRGLKWLLYLGDKKDDR